MLKLTVIIPTGNEAHNIEAVIASVDFADEILVADSFSTDGTYEKSKELGVNIIRREFKYFADHKNWAIPQAKNEWILLLDADENYFMGKLVKHSGWRNDSVIRLFKRDECKYKDIHVHEEIITKGGSIGRLKHKLYHNTYTSFDDYIEKRNRYSSLQAKDYDKKTGRLTLYHFIIKPSWRFIKHFIIQGGFRDGLIGFIISYLHSYSVFTRYVKVWLLRKKLK